MQALVAAALLALSAPLISNGSFVTASDTLDTLPEHNTAQTDVVRMPVSVETESQFTEEREVVEEAIPFETIFEENDEEELGYQEVTQEGVEGLRTEVYVTTYWEGEEVSSELLETTVVEPTDQVVVKGTKTVIRDLDTVDLGTIEYKEKLHVWSTSYDGDCVGCTGRTYTGKLVTHGICATDPTVIPLGTSFYVPGYGMCSAQDIGGAIKGNKVDLGFEDVRNGWWSARYTDIYILP